MEDLKLPEKGFTKREREWLQELIEAIHTARAIAGRNTNIAEHPGEGTVINAEDCKPCS